MERECASAHSSIFVMLSTVKAATAAIGAGAVVVFLSTHGVHTTVAVIAVLAHGVHATVAIGMPAGTASLVTSPVFSTTPALVDVYKRQVLHHPCARRA